MVIRSPRARRTGLAAIALLILIGALYLLTGRFASDDFPGDDAPTVPLPDAVLDRSGADPSPADRGDAPDGASHALGAALTTLAKVAPDAPTLDVVRIDARGAAIAAGKAAVDEEVVLRIDGEPVATAKADAAGNFVSLFDMSIADAPRLLTIESRSVAGAVTRAQDGIIVAPTRPEAPVAAAAFSAPLRWTSAATPRADAAIPDDDAPASAASEGAALAGPVGSNSTGFAAAASATAPMVGVSQSVSPGAVLVAPSPSAQPQIEAVASMPAPPAGPRPVSLPKAETMRAAPQDAGPTGPGARRPPGGGLGPLAPGPGIGTPTAVAAAPGPAAGRDRITRPVVASDPRQNPDAPILTGAPTAPAAVATRDPAGQPETAAPRLFHTGPDGVRVLRSGPPRPDATETLGIDSISYDAGGAVQLAGRAGPDAALRIYLDGRPVQSAQVGPDGSWTSPLPDVRTGVYTLRIDAVAADGTVIARVETPFQRTAPEIAAAARRDGVTAITVQPGFTLWAISKGWFGEGVRYVQIFEANRDQIRNPDLIYPGQVFALPDGAAATR